MALLTNMFGGPALNSIFGLLIREKHGYAYSVESAYTSYSDAGFWSLYLGTDKKYLAKSLELIKEELSKYCQGGVTDKELIEAKEQLKGHLALSLDSNLELMFSVAKSMLMFNRVDSTLDIYRQIDAIEKDEVNRLLNDYMHPDQLSTLIFDY